MMRSRVICGSLVAAAALGTGAVAVAGGGHRQGPSYASRDCGNGVAIVGFSDALDKTTFAGTDVGGLSALARSGTGYLALVDNQAATPARLYRLRVPVGREKVGTPVVTGITRLTGPGGTPFTGANFDGEGLVRRGGSLYASSETEPSIFRFDLKGRLKGELPVPARFRVAPAGQATRNLTFETLTIAPGGGSLYTALEGPLAPDGATADGRSRLRILRYVRARGGVYARTPSYAPGRGGGYTPAQQYYYLSEPGQGVVDAIALSGRALLVLERGFVAGQGNTVRLFKVSLKGATDVRGVASLADPGLRPVAKRLVVDPGSCPRWGRPTPGPRRTRSSTTTRPSRSAPACGASGRCWS